MLAVQDTFYIIWIEKVLGHDVVGRLRTELLVIVSFVVRIVRDAHLAGSPQAGDIAVTFLRIRRQGDLETEPAIGMRALVDSFHGIESDGTVAEMPDHLELGAQVSDQELFRPEGELRLQHRTIVVDRKVPIKPEIRIRVGRGCPRTSCLWHSLPYRSDRR